MIYLINRDYIVISEDQCDQMNINRSTKNFSYNQKFLGFSPSLKSSTRRLRAIASSNVSPGRILTNCGLVCELPGIISQRPGLNANLIN